MVPIPTLPPNVANPDDRNVVVVAFVVTSLLIQAVSETERYVEEALVMVPPVVVRLVIVPVVDQKLVAVKLVEEALVTVPVVAMKLFAVTSPDGAIEKTEEVEE